MGFCSSVKIIQSGTKPSKMKPYYKRIKSERTPSQKLLYLVYLIELIEYETVVFGGNSEMYF